MGNNSRLLGRARGAKNDEFYTCLEDINQELKHYGQHFMGKTIFCNCDDPYESNFFKYFVLKFNDLHLKRLIAASYDGSPIQGTELSLFWESPTTTKKAHKIIVDEVKDWNADGAVDLEDMHYWLSQPEHHPELMKGNGDFRSQESIELLKQADIVVTNPPFSLFREYVAQLLEYDKKFLIIGNVNAISYKEIFPLLRDNKLWMGISIHSGDREFKVPEYYPLDAAGTRIDEIGQRFIRVKGVRWFTNLDIKKRHEPLELIRHYSPEKYPKYDNYDAIEVPMVNDIPDDYMGVMGVPITFMDKYCPEQFEIIDINPHFFSMVNQGLPKLKQLTLHSVGQKDPYARLLIRRKG